MNGACGQARSSNFVQLGAVATKVRVVEKLIAARPIHHYRRANSVVFAPSAQGKNQTSAENERGIVCSVVQGFSAL